MQRRYGVPLPPTHICDFWVNIYLISINLYKYIWLYTYIYLVDSQNRWLLDTSISIMYKIGDFKGENKKFRIVFLINPWNFNVIPSIPNHLILPDRDRQYTLISSNSACFTKVLRTYEQVFLFLLTGLALVFSRFAYFMMPCST